MKQLILLALLSLVTSVFAYDNANIETIAHMKNNDNSGSGLRMYIFSLKHDKTALYCTGIVTSDELQAMNNSMQYTGHKMTRGDFIGAKKQGLNFNDSDWQRRFNAFDGNGNGIGDWKEMVAGGEPLYWTSCGNGWQFYVNGAMYACNSDTDWENVLYKDTPQVVQQQYPDENGNGIPDIVDAAIAAGGGATSEGGNITVTVNNQDIKVTVDNQPVLQALQALSAKLDSLETGGGGSGGGITPEDLQAIISAINAAGFDHATDEMLASIYRDWKAEWGTQFGLVATSITTVMDSLHDGDESILKVTKDLRYLLETLKDGFTSGEIWSSFKLEEHWKVEIEGLDNIIQGMQDIYQVNIETRDNTGAILKHLREVQQPQLEVIKTNTKDTADTLKQILTLLTSFSGASVGDADEPDKESADEFVDEAQKGVDDYKKDFEEDDKATEDEAANLKDYHKDKQSHGERIRDKLCGLFGIDVKRLKPSSQETGQFELTWYQTGPLAKLTGDSSVHGKRLTQSVELDPRRFLDGRETWNGEDSTIMRDAYRDNVIPAMDIARTFLLFLVAWYFLGAMFDLVKDTWSS